MLISEEIDAGTPIPESLSLVPARPCLFHHSLLLERGALLEDPTWNVFVRNFVKQRAPYFTQLLGFDLPENVALVWLLFEVHLWLSCPWEVWPKPYIFSRKGTHWASPLFVTREIEGRACHSLFLLLFIIVDIVDALVLSPVVILLHQPVIGGPRWLRSHRLRAAPPLWNIHDQGISHAFMLQLSLLGYSSSGGQWCGPCLRATVPKLFLHRSLGPWLELFD